ncbi:MAG: SUMF1/EgtB/PvdO family nonheme iron enzyme [Polyangiaceae bacterium]|nr:SUMF1/EgtB/PvdO family nonheme iron enzyme [Polyangiaceae bacterium]
MDRTIGTIAVDGGPEERHAGDATRHCIGDQALVRTTDMGGAKQDQTLEEAIEFASTYLPAADAATNRSDEPARVTLPGRYVDLGRIAAGAFGEVRRVRDTLLDRVVAMKLLHAEHASAGHLRQRFWVEVQITAQLQHPGIVAVYDRGELADGRAWYTMKEIRGRTLRDVIDEVHAAADPNAFGPTASGWTFRRLVDAFGRIVQAVAYAHRRGIVHRDLKPENMMVGEFAEVLVMDWGLARRLGRAAEHEGFTGEFGATASAALTQHGDILGTPAYMSPEQARGALSLHGPPSDVYSLGAVLYSLLSGRPPYEGLSSREVLRAVLEGPPKPVAEASEHAAPLPRELCAICERAMQREITQRYPDAAAMSEDLVAWLDGVRLREQALEALHQARAYEPEITRLRGEARAMRALSRSMQNDVRPRDPVEKKIPAWDMEDEAKRLGRLAALSETKWLEAVHGSLSVDPGLPEAHALLADHYRQRLVEAERDHRDEDAARAEELLRIHDRGQHAAFLRGDGRLTLVTDPPGAEVFVDRYELQHRRLVPVPEGLLGKTPLACVPLRRGSYLLRIRAPGRVEVRYPVLIERDGFWDGVDPGQDKPFPIHLPMENELLPNEIYVPAGYAWTGGDPDAPDGLPARRVWIDAFVIGRYPVTNEEYLAFLNDLVQQGRETEALEACPRAHHGMVLDSEHAFAYARDEKGLFQLRKEHAGTIWQLRGPVMSISWQNAVAYSAWLMAKRDLPYRLPNELEREKAVRGVDARRFSWGDHFDATFACVMASQGETPAAAEVTAYPMDESPYGMRGGSGNTRDFCGNSWTMEGPAIREGRLLIEAPPTDDYEYRSCRGGAWNSVENLNRAAGRLVARPNVRRNTTGVRVARSYSP